jgi:hypothetical protein
MGRNIFIAIGVGAVVVALGILCGWLGGQFKFAPMRECS